MQQLTVFLAIQQLCRDVGYRNKYSDKVKNDPVWLTYSRAYKAHYARYMKKKMTQSEFQKWVDFALRFGNEP